MVGSPRSRSMPLKNDVVRAEMSTAPASAVPIDAPRLVKVFWMPPTSPLCSSGTADTVTAPSWEASAPMPRPARSSGTVTICCADTELEGGHQGHDAREERQEAQAHHPPRRGLREEPRHPDCCQQQGDRERHDPQAGVDRAEPEGHREEERHAEEQTGLEQELEEERDQAHLQLRDAQHRGVEQRRPPGGEPAVLPRQEGPDHERARQDQPDHRRQAGPRGGARLGVHETPGAGLEDAEHDQPQPERRQQRCRRGRARRPRRPPRPPSDGRAPG